MMKGSVVGEEEALPNNSPGPCQGCHLEMKANGAPGSLENGAMESGFILKNCALD